MLALPAEARVYRSHLLRGAVKVLCALLASVESEDTLGGETVEAVRALLAPTSACLGPIREYLLRPPTENDSLLVQYALQRMPEIRTLVRPWLRPPMWSPSW